MRRRGREHLDLVEKNPHCYHNQIQTITAPTNPCTFCKRKHQRGFGGQSERRRARPATPHSCPPLPPSTWLHADVKTCTHLNTAQGQLYEHLRTSRANVLHSVERVGAEPEETSRSTNDSLTQHLTWHHWHVTCWEVLLWYFDDFLRLLVYVADKKLQN